jgi:DNA invertase Pin-like site-specific DNA recombinase
VVRGNTQYRAILVYDVSRWGRFQDTDESAHYEFLCKSAGVPIHYCAETFSNDGTLPSLFMKALKRTMAGEFSRELGVKVLQGQKRLAGLGFKQGGRPGYGLRRLLVSSDRVPKQPLALGERKSITTDRVILVPGPAHEVQCVKNIFRMLLSEKRTVFGIARELNRSRIPYVDNGRWDYGAVYNILTHPKYCGCHVYGRTSTRLYTPTIKLPKSQWILTPGAFEPLVDAATFEAAQKVLQERTFRKSDEDVLDNLRKLLSEKGSLSISLIRNSDGMPSWSTYRYRFGGLRRAYELIGYESTYPVSALDVRSRAMTLREGIIARIKELFPRDFSILKRSGRWRTRLLFLNREVVSVMIARADRVWKQTIRWMVDPHPQERNFITLMARLNENNDDILDYYVFPRIESRKRIRLKLKDPRLNQGRKIHDLSELRKIMEQFTKGPIKSRWKQPLIDT